jgi:hypothetical protein
MGIGKDLRGIFHDQLEVPCGFEQMKKDDVLIQFEVHCDWNRCEGMLT